MPGKDLQPSDASIFAKADRFDGLVKLAVELARDVSLDIEPPIGIEPSQVLSGAALSSDRPFPGRVCPNA